MGYLISEYQTLPPRNPETMVFPGDGIWDHRMEVLRLLRTFI